MLWGGSIGHLEVRAGDGNNRTRLTATFPYGVQTELAPGRLEVIAPRAFRDRIEAGEDIHLLSGHSYERPLASRSTGSLTLTEDDEALTIEAMIEGNTSWARDFLEAHKAGLIKGISPGFRVEPRGETIEQRGVGILRTIHKAALYELSTVTRPAYPTAQVEARSWDNSYLGSSDNQLVHALNRWRL